MYGFKTEKYSNHYAQLTKNVTYDENTSVLKLHTNKLRGSDLSLINLLRNPGHWG